MRKEYYEGTLQLRNPSKEVISAVKCMIESRADVWIAKESKVTNGIDMQVSSWEFLIALGRRLQQKFGGEVKVTRRLFTTRDGKQIYRVCVLFRLPWFKKGDIVKVGKKTVRVDRLEKKVFGTDIEKGKKISFNYDMARR